MDEIKAPPHPKPLYKVGTYVKVESIHRYTYLVVLREDYYLKDTYVKGFKGYIDTQGKGFYNNGNDFCTDIHSIQLCTVEEENWLRRSKSAGYITSKRLTQEGLCCVRTVSEKSTKSRNYYNEGFIFISEETGANPRAAYYAYCSSVSPGNFRYATAEEEAWHKENKAENYNIALMSRKQNLVPDTNSTIEELLAYAEENYPVGTVYIPAHIPGSSSACTVSTRRFLTGGKSIYQSHGDKSKNGHSYSEFIFSEELHHGWAKIISRPAKLTTKEPNKTEESSFKLVIKYSMDTTEEVDKLITEAYKRYSPGTVFTPSHVGTSEENRCIVTLDDTIDIYVGEQSIAMSSGNIGKNGHDLTEILWHVEYGWAPIVSPTELHYQTEDTLTSVASKEDTPKKVILAKEYEAEVSTESIQGHSVYIKTSSNEDNLVSLKPKKSVMVTLLPFKKRA